MLNNQQLADELGVTTTVVELWRRTDLGPPAVLLAGRPVYLRQDVDAWLDAGGARLESIAPTAPSWSCG